MPKPENVTRKGYKVKGGYSYGGYSEPTLVEFDVVQSPKRYTVDWAAPVRDRYVPVLNRQGEPNKGLGWSWTPLDAWVRFRDEQTQAQEEAQNEVAGALRAKLAAQHMINKLIATEASNG